MFVIAFIIILLLSIIIAVLIFTLTYLIKSHYPHVKQLEEKVTTLQREVIDTINKNTNVLINTMNNQFITMNSISTNITNNFELLRKDIVIYNQSVNTKIQEETNKTNSLMHEYYTKNKEYELSDAKHKIVQLETYLFNKDLFTTSNHKRNE